MAKHSGIESPFEEGISRETGGQPKAARHQEIEATDTWTPGEGAKKVANPTGGVLVGPDLPKRKARR